jgi:hypothetical protein
MKDDLMLTTKYWYSVADLAARYHVSEKTVRLHILPPHRGRCHLARRGRHPRLLLWIPAEVVRLLDRERRATQQRAS